MPLTDEEQLELLELEKQKAMAIGAPVHTEQPKEEPSFFSGMKAGLSAQPGEGVGHFIGAALPATVGAALGGPIGATLGEAARQTAGAIVNPEATAKKSPLAIGAEVAGAGVGQKISELPGVNKAISAGVSKVGTGITNISDWLATQAGKKFIKASEKLNAYGHIPEKAIVDEGIYGSTWESILTKTEAAKEKIGEAMNDVLKAPEAQTPISITHAVKPIDEALREANKYPDVNSGVINGLSKLKKNVIARIKKLSTIVDEYEIKPTEDIPNNWNKDIVTTFGKDLQTINKEVGPNLYKESAKNTAKESADSTFEAELVSRKRVMTPETANNMKREIYALAKYSGNPSDDAAINKVKQYVAAVINKEVEKAQPAMIPLNYRYGNLSALDSAITHRAPVAQRNNWFGVPEMFALGLTTTGNIPAAAAVELGGRALMTPLGASGAIKGLSTAGKVASKVTPSISILAADISKRLGGGISPQIIEQIIPMVQNTESK